MHIVGYIGCAAIFILMLGVVFHAVIWPKFQRSKKSVLGWVVSLVFGFGMLHSMAVMPGGGDALQGPRRSPAQQAAELTNSVEIATSTNAPLSETSLAFSQIETMSSNVQLTAAWPLGFFNYDPILDLFIAKPQLTNDWQWITSQNVASSATNFTSTLSRTFTLGNSGRTNQITSVGHEATVFIDLTPGLDSDNDGIPNIQELEEHGTDPWLADSDGDGIPDPDELIAETDPLDVLSFLHGVVIEVTNTTAVAGSQVYVSWERIGDYPDNRVTSSLTVGWLSFSGRK